jgi:hypothetical protein
VDQSRRKSAVNFVPQAIDVHVHNIAHRIEVDVPDMLDDHRSRHRAPRVSQQKFQ